MRITRGSVVAEIPIASIFASKAEGSTPNKTKTASVGYGAHLKIGDKIEFVYFYKTSSEFRLLLLRGRVEGRVLHRENEVEGRAPSGRGRECSLGTSR